MNLKKSYYDKGVRKTNFIRKFCIGTICSALISSQASAMLYEVTASDGLNIRSGPSSSERCCDDPLSNGDIVDVTEVRGNWGRISSGWICLNFARPTQQKFVIKEFKVASGNTLSAMTVEISRIPYKANKNWIFELNKNNIKSENELSIGEIVRLPVRCTEEEIKAAEAERQRQEAERRAREEKEKREREERERLEREEKEKREREERERLEREEKEKHEREEKERREREERERLEREERERREREEKREATEKELRKKVEEQDALIKKQSEIIQQKENEIEQLKEKNELLTELNRFYKDRERNREAENQNREDLIIENEQLKKRLEEMSEKIEWMLNESM